MTVADRIRYMRDERQLTQLELAQRMGYKTKSAVCKIEASGNDITLKIVSKAAAALGVSEAYLMGWNEPTEYEIESGGTTFHAELQPSDKAMRIARKYDKADSLTKEMVDRILKEE